MGYNFTPVRMAIIKKSTNNILVRKWEAGTFVNYWWESILVQLLWKTVWSILKNSKIGLPYDPAILLLSIYLKKMKILIQKYTCTPMFIATLFVADRTWMQLRCPSTDKRIKKIYSVIRRTNFCHL